MGKKETKKMNKKKKHTHVFSYFFFFSLSLEQCWGMTPACGVSSILLTYTHTHTHTHHTYSVAEGIIAEHSLSLYSASLPLDWYKSPGHTYP